MTLTEIQTGVLTIANDDTKTLSTSYTEAADLVMKFEEEFDVTLSHQFMAQDGLTLGMIAQQIYDIKQEA